jgi:AcrR family transcriptional regulator
MSEHAEQIKLIRKAARRREKAKKELLSATDELRVYCLQAKYQGISVTQMASEAGLSRQGVYDLLVERPSS